MFKKHISGAYSSTAAACVNFSSRVNVPLRVERNIVMANMSVCLSVTRWCYIKTNAHIVKLFPSPGMGMTCLLRPTTVTKIHGELLQRGRDVKYIGWKFATFD